MSQISFEEKARLFVANAIKEKISKSTNRYFMGKEILELNDVEVYELMRVLQDFGISIEYDRFDFINESDDSNIYLKAIPKIRLIYRGKEIDSIDEVIKWILICYAKKIRQEIIF